IRHAILRLGEGDFASLIAISGPRDLEYLGQSLDWLRVRLVELEGEKRKVLGRVSHELKTPLAAICEGVDLLAEEVVGMLNEQQHEIVNILQQKSKQFQNLIEDFLNFSMIQARDASLVLKPVELDRLIDEVAMDHKPVIIAKEVQLEIKSSKVLVLGDQEKLRIIVDNLLSNAVKYAPDGGRIGISLQCQNDCAVLDVVDSGPGIDPSETESVFEAFYQGSITPQNYIKGSGLGLSIAREYLVAHHGSIAIMHENSSGAHFRVTLPVHGTQG
ncbi:MAG: HAMP domain-containing sensor histidine kinase, partial [Nitrosomonadaceae bacterium]